VGSHFNNVFLVDWWNVGMSYIGLKEPTVIEIEIEIGLKKVYVDLNEKKELFLYRDYVMFVTLDFSSLRKCEMQPKFLKLIRRFPSRLTMN
jgi:hypothetical protein